MPSMQTKINEDYDLWFEVFKDNVAFIEEHNTVDRPYRLGLNQFADMTNEEFRVGLKYRDMARDEELRDLYSEKRKKEEERYLWRKGDALPERVDWREKGVVGKVKNQGHCSGNFTSWSEQELVDCDTNNNGCDDGNLNHAFEFIVNNGISYEEDYPYTGREGTCDQTRKNARVVTIDCFEPVPRKDEKSLQKAVANQPISVSIEAGGRAASCMNPKWTDYWLLRSSWGPGWGESGYLRLERNINHTRTGKCGIAMDAFYPLKTNESTEMVTTVWDGGVTRRNRPPAAAIIIVAVRMIILIPTLMDL
ncbi:Cysteine proteinase mucunain-like protein [Drosera capensis]